jgi:NADPH2:quinone reductase
VLLARSARCATLNLSVVFAQQPEAMHEAWAGLVAMWAAGALRPRIGRRFSLADAAAAQQWLESRASTDKILLQVPLADGMGFA